MRRMKAGAIILQAVECSKPDLGRASRLDSVLSGDTPGERE